MTKSTPKKKPAKPVKPVKAFALLEEGEISLSNIYLHRTSAETIQAHAYCEYDGPIRVEIRPVK